MINPKENPNILEFSDFPFFIGVLDSPENKGLPLRLPFALELDKDFSLIVQRYNEENEKFIKRAYKKGSLLSTNLGQGSFGISRAEDVIEHLLKISRLPINETSFMEVGCGDGYLLHRLNLLGAKEVMGCEPGPAGIEGKKKYRIKISNNFYKPKLFREKFDIILSYGFLEHVHKPLEIINLFKTNLKENGKIFIAVPNCENKLKMGDISLLGHEHWNYFTRGSLRNLLLKSNLFDIGITLGKNEAMIYGWGAKTGRNEKAIGLANSNKQLFYALSAKIKRILSIFQKRIELLEQENKTIGFYAGGLCVIGVLKHKLEPRFFDGDIAKHGKFFPGYKNSIESPVNLIRNKVDELWIMAIDYNDEIVNYLKHGLKISADTKIVSFKKFLEDDGKVI